MRFLKPILFVVLFLVSCLFIRVAHAQTLPQNLSNINIDNISDGQLTQLLQQAQAAGLSDDQLVQQAQSRGLPADQADKLQKRIADFRKSSNVNTNSSRTLPTTDTSSKSRKLNFKQDTTRTDTSKKNLDIFNSLKPKIFGADLFRNNNLTFEPNLKLATPANYILGPEDQVDINIYGSSVVDWKLDVSPDGNINLPGVGLLNVSGKSITQATQAIKARLASSNYAVGHGTTVQVSLGNIRSIKVIIAGEAMRPGTYTLPSLATVFNALYAAGGPNDNGSFRQIEIIRNNEIFKRLDVYDFLLKGQQKNNIVLQDQDIIRIPTYRVRVQMAGEVKIPALFEVLPGETLKDVIQFAGGFTDQAYTALIKVTQISNQQLHITDVAEDDYKNYIPLKGDVYLVGHILDRYENRLTITGAVFRPGDYELQKGTTLLQLIDKAAGLKEDAFMGTGTIVRLNPDNTTQSISFNLKDIISKTAPDVPLQREDVVNIASVFDLRDKYSVTIKGEVRHSGQFDYAENMTVEALIVEAGGFAEGASAKRIEVARRVNNSDPTSKNSPVAQVFTVDVDANLKNSTANFTLKPYDVVSIFSLPGYETQRIVKIEGEVIYPGYYTIRQKNEKISDVVKRAGGLSASADVDGGTLRRNNIAILGVEKSKADTAELEQERAARLTRLKNNFQDSSAVKTTKTKDTLILRNNYVGIDLKKILEQPGSNIDLLMEDGDVIRVPKQQQIVRINGEVLYPSAVVYSRNKSFISYVLNAGGFSPNALKKRAYIVYPNGTVRGTRKFLFFNSHPEVRPGSEIYVPKKPESKGNTVQEVLGFTTGLASLGAIILGIISLHK